MEKPTVSVIVPVYKTEEFLEECVASIQNQDYPAVEIILVDDGSPDQCPEICNQLVAHYENIRVIHKENQGLGMARNSGLEVACGEYVMFLDSDDKLDGDKAISVLAEEAVRKKADIVTGSFRRFHADFTSEKNWHHLKEGEYTETVDFRFKGFFQYGHLAYDWGKLYRKAFLEEHDLKCPAYPFTQDKAHNMRCCSWKPVYAFVEDSVVLYRVNEASVTFKYKENLMDVWTDIAKDFMRYQRECGRKGKMADLAAFHIFFGVFFLAKQELQPGRNGWKGAKTALKKYGEDEFVREAMKVLARGRYVRKIESYTWKLVIRTASLLFSLHAYSLLAAGIVLLRKLEIDSKITKARYRKG